MAEAQSASANKQNARFRLISVLLAMLINDGGASFEREKLRGSLSQKSSPFLKSFFSRHIAFGAVPQRLLTFSGIVSMDTAGSTSSSHWLAIYTSARHEKHVTEQLNDRQFETFLPLYRAVHVWKNRSKVTLDLPLFPCYLFVRTRHEQRGKVLSVPGVLSIVGSKQEPAIARHRNSSATLGSAATQRSAPFLPGRR